MFKEGQSISSWDDFESGPNVFRLFEGKQICLGFK